MTKYIAFFVVLLMAAAAFGQGTGVIDMPANTAPTGDDLVYVVDDPSGTPADTKSTRAEFLGETSKGIALNTPTASDDFCVWKVPKALTITHIYGVVLSGTVTGGFDECDSDCQNCVAVDADISFDGNLDQDDGSLSNAGIAAGNWIKWHTAAVSSPGWFTVQYDFTWD